MNSGRVQALLQETLDQCEALAGTICEREGSPLVQVIKAERSDFAQLSQEFAEVLDQVRNTAEILKLGQPEELSIIGTTYAFCFYLLDAHYFIGIAMAPEANIARGRFRLRMAIPHLREQLGA